MAVSIWRRLVDDLVEVRPAPHAHRVAARAAASVLVPLLLLWWTQRLDLSVYATFGALTAVYGGGHRTPTRWRTQAWIGMILATATIIGALVALSPMRSWLSIPVSAAWAGLVAPLSDRQRWRPPGPMLPVFVVATCAAIPSTSPQVAEASVVVVLTAGLAVGLGAIEVRLLRRRPSIAPPPPPGPRPARQRIQMIRCPIVVLIAGTIATASGIGHPYWAMVSALVPLTVLTFRGQLVRGLQRTLGTLAGIGVAAALLWIPLPEQATILVIGALFAATELLVVRNYGAALITITPLALLSVQLAHAESVPDLLMDRLHETLIGVAVGMIAAIITRDRNR